MPGATYKATLYGTTTYAGGAAPVTPELPAAGFCLVAINADACGGHCLAAVYPGSVARVLVYVFQGEAYADPDVLVALLEDPSGDVTRHEFGESDAFVKDAVGQYHFDFLVSESGTYSYRFETDGAGSTEGAVKVYASAFALA